MAAKKTSHMLDKTEKSLPKQFYLDEAHYKKELDAIWFKKWLYVCRSQAIENQGDFQVLEVGDQSIVITRGKEGSVHAFHNTCRHRGSILTTESSGCFQKKAITCPYHAWTYTLEGKLAGTPNQLKCDDFDKEDYALFGVGIEEWEGCLFVHLAPKEAPPLQDVMEEESFMPKLKDWNIKTLQPNFYSEMILECNWKIFWENYSECFHCPGVHPEFCDLVPIYGKGLLDDDPPALKNHKSSPEDLPEAGFRPGAVTWSMDGKTEIPSLPGLTAEDKAAGYHYFTMTPGFILEALEHCVVLMRILPLAPDKTQATMEVLFHPSAVGKYDEDMKKINDFLDLVMRQDCRICEINQKGMHSNRFENGVLAPQEYGVHAFQNWVLGELGQYEKVKK